MAEDREDERTEEQGEKINDRRKKGVGGYGSTF